MFLRCSLVGLALVVACATACGPRPAATGAKWPEASILIVSIDTLRADHLPAYGYAAGRTPNIDRMARDGVVFENAYSTSPLTLPSHASILTGLLQSRHGVADNLGFVLDSSHHTLATRLAGVGWRTGAAVSSYVLRRETGIGRGFDFWDDRIERPASLDALGSVQRDGDASVAALTQWIAAQGEHRFLAFLHLYEPHTPYAPPSRFHDLALPYDGDIAYADELAWSLDGEPASRRDGWISHGGRRVVRSWREGLGDHGESEHGIFLYREAVHVPLVVRLPGVREPVVGSSHREPRRRRADDSPSRRPSPWPNSTVARCGRHSRDSLWTMRRRNPRRSIRDCTLAERAAGDERRAVSLRRGPARGAVRSHPRSGRATRSGRRATRNGRGNAHLDFRRRRGGEAEPRPVSSEVRERLASLGYVGSTAAADRRRFPDPEGLQSAATKLLPASAGGARPRRSRGRDRGPANVDCRAAGDADAWEALATCPVKTGRTRDAVAAFERVLALDSGQPETHLALARIHAGRGPPRSGGEHTPRLPPTPARPRVTRCWRRCRSTREICPVPGPSPNAASPSIPGGP